MRALLFVCLGLLGCAGQQNKPVSETPNATSAARGESAPPSRFLSGEAIYADLVRTVGVLEPTNPDGEHCLLAKGQREYRLAADFASAIYPLPEVLEDLDDAVLRASYVRVLSRWGQHGRSGAELTMATLTDLPATRDALTILMTDQGIYVRPSDLEHNTRTAVAKDAELLSLLEEAGALAQSTALIVSAEAGVPVRRVHALLEVLADRSAGPVAFGLVLPAGTPIAESNGQGAAPALCPDGLPESDSPEGELDVSVIQQAVYPLREQASACLARADARGAAGGKLSIALRIGPDGRVQTACVEANETEDDALSSCVLEVMRTLSLPAPSPSGEIDLSLPLVLRQINTPAQAAVCRPTE